MSTASLSSPSTSEAPVPRTLLETMLADARSHLVWCQTHLAICRLQQASGAHVDPAAAERVAFALSAAEDQFRTALDRVWEIQCMTTASF